MYTSDQGGSDGAVRPEARDAAEGRQSTVGRWVTAMVKQHLPDSSVSLATSAANMGKSVAGRLQTLLVETADRSRPYLSSCSGYEFVLSHPCAFWVGLIHSTRDPKLQKLFTLSSHVFVIVCTMVMKQFH